MSDARTVLIAAAARLPALVGHFPSDGSLLTFEDAEVVRALRTIIKRRPPLVVLERQFAATPRGTALIARIKADPTLDALEIRVMSDDGEVVRTVRRAKRHVEVSGQEPARELDPTGTRRAPRFQIRPETDVKVDGNAVTLVNLSLTGAQVLSPLVLRPNQRVLVTLADAAGTVSVRATVAWASFVRPHKGAEPCYRAGVEFAHADKDALQAFCYRNAD